MRKGENLPGATLMEVRERIQSGKQSRSFSECYHTWNVRQHPSSPYQIATKSGIEPRLREYFINVFAVSYSCELHYISIHKNPNSVVAGTDTESIIKT